MFGLCVIGVGCGKGVVVWVAGNRKAHTALAHNKKKKNRTRVFFRFVFLFSHYFVRAFFFFKWWLAALFVGVVVVGHSGGVVRRLFSLRSTTALFFSLLFSLPLRKDEAPLPASRRLAANKKRHHTHPPHPRKKRHRDSLLASLFYVSFWGVRGGVRPSVPLCPPIPPPSHPCVITYAH